MKITEVKQKLKEMVEIDQKGRLVETIDWEIVKKVDIANTQVLKEIVEEYGWPTISMFGEECVRQAWIIAQHADKSPEVQAGFLKAMKKLPESEISKKAQAYLEDRVMLKRDHVQKYGTQLKKHEGKTYFLLMPLLDKGKLDEWRAEVGLNPIREYLNLEEIRKQGGAYIDEEDYIMQTSDKQTS